MSINFEASIINAQDDLDLDLDYDNAVLEVYGYKPVYITTEAFRVNVITVTSLVALPIVLLLLIYIMIKPVEKNSKNIIIEKYLFPSKKGGGGKSNEKKNK